MIKRFLIYVRRGFNNYRGFVTLVSCAVTVAATISLSKLTGCKNIWLLLAVYGATLATTMMFSSAILSWVEHRRYLSKE